MGRKVIRPRQRRSGYKYLDVRGGKRCTWMVFQEVLDIGVGELERTSVDGCQ